MIKHFILTAWRNIKRRKALSFIQIMCLSIGLSAFILVVKYVQYEKDWDKFNANFDRIYRAQSYKETKRLEDNTNVVVPLSKYLKSNYAEVEDALVLRGVWGEYLSSDEEHIFHERDGMLAPSRVFKMFSFNLLQGNKKTVLDKPNAIVLSKSLAQKYFPGENAMGKSIFDKQKTKLVVTGIMEDIPEQSVINASYFKSNNNLLRKYEDNWGNSSFWSYILLKPNVSAEAFSNKIANIMKEFDTESKHILYLKPLTDLHLKENAQDDRGAIIFFFSFIGVLTLLLASVSFMNLSTSFSTLRSVEIGVRKVSGSSNRFIQWQFITESVVLAFISLAIAIFISILILPVFNSVVNRNIELNLFTNPLFMGFILLTVLLTGVLSGMYPAFIISRFKPVTVLKGKSPFVKRKISGLKLMVYFQFILSIVLITSSLWMYKQVNFLKNKDLGFKKENLLHTNMPAMETDISYDQVRNQILEYPGINNMTLSINSPLHSNWGTRLKYQDGPLNDYIYGRWNRACPNYLNTMGMQLVAGRSFTDNYELEKNKCLINETAVKQFGWKHPIGKWVDKGGKCEVIGVIKDFIIDDVHNPILPYVLYVRNNDFGNYNDLTFSVNPNNLEGSLEHINTTLSKLFPNVLFEVNGYDIGTFRLELQIWKGAQNTFAFFTFMAVIIAALGLFGLVFFVTQRRVKEIGIRKVQGAKAWQIFPLLTKQFLFLVIIANVNVIPLAYLLESVTPGQYKYHFSIFDLLIVLAISVFITLASSGFQAIKASLLNPIKALRYE